MKKIAKQIALSLLLIPFICGNLAARTISFENNTDECIEDLGEFLFHDTTHFEGAEVYVNSQLMPSNETVRFDTQGKEKLELRMVLHRDIIHDIKPAEKFITTKVRPHLNADWYGWAVRAVYERTEAVEVTFGYLLEEDQDEVSLFDIFDGILELQEEDLSLIHI